jgi:hypothetical protein
MKSIHAERFEQPSSLSIAGPPSGLWIFPAALVIVSTLLQLPALWLHQQSVATLQGQAWFGLLEMLLITALILNGWRIRHWLFSANASPLVLTVATFCLLSLLVCGLGDLVNRNFPQAFYQYDSVIEHSYLADSVWFFLPGYSLFIRAAWLATPSISRPVKTATACLAALLGLMSFLGMVLEDTSSYVRLITGAYSMLITAMVAAGLWIALRYKSRVGLMVALGAALAALADAVIGQFWLYGSGYYPQVSHVNWIVYFLSQAMIQQLPLVVHTAKS